MNKTNDDITLKDFILKLRVYFTLLMRKWWLLILLSIIPASYFAYLHYTHIPNYNAEVLFIVEGEDNNSGIAGMKGILNSIGINNKKLGVNPFKIVEVATSLSIVSEVLFKSSNTNDDFLINNIISKYNLSESWQDNEYLSEDFQFENSAIDSFNLGEKIAFKITSNKTIGTKHDRTLALLSIGFDNKSAIFKINANTIDPNLSEDLANSMFEELKVFFEEDVLEEKKQARDILKNKLDSLNNVVDQKIARAAFYEDRSRDIVSKSANTEYQKIKIEIAGLTSAISEIQKSLELSDFEFRNNQPYFMKISSPFQPLSGSRMSMVNSLLMSIIIGMVLWVCVVVSMKIYKDAMKEL